MSSYYATRPLAPPKRVVYCTRCQAEIANHLSPLTKRQSEIYGYLREYITLNGYAPSFEEIAFRFSYSSLATVHEHLSNLESKGWITRVYNEPRAITLVGALP